MNATTSIAYQWIEQIKQAASNSQYKLHARPLSHQFHFAINNLSILIQQKVNIKDQPRTILAKAIVISGYILNTLLALVETIASATIALFALSFHAATKGQFKNHRIATLKIWAYSVNAAKVLLQQIDNIIKGPFLKYYSMNIYDDHYLHLSSALHIQAIAYRTNKTANPHQLSHQNIAVLRFLIEKIPLMIHQISQKIEKDSSYYTNCNKTLQENLEAMLLNNYTPELPNNLEYHKHLSHHLLERLVNEKTIEKIIQNIRLEDMDMSPCQIAEMYDNYKNTISYDEMTDENDKAYRGYLSDLVRTSLENLYRNPNLVCYLSNEQDENKAIQGGRDELASYHAIPQFANYVQLQEIVNKIKCPTKFHAESLQNYNARYQLIVNVKKRVQGLTKKEMKILIKKLLKTGDYELKATRISNERVEYIKKIFQDISLLSFQLHKGELLLQKFVSIKTLKNPTVFSAGLLQQACKETLSKIQRKENLIRLVLQESVNFSV